MCDRLHSLNEEVRVVLDTTAARRKQFGLWPVSVTFSHLALLLKLVMCGAFTGTKRRISKRGSSLLRKTGYEVMKCIKSSKPSYDTAVYDYMLKKEAEGKPKKVAKIAALNKFLRIYYA